MRRQSRSLLFAAVAAAALLSLAGCRSSPADPPVSGGDRIDRSLAKAVHYLLDRQSPDGAWRSDVYGAFKDGDALTPLVLEALLAAEPATGRNSEPSCRKGAGYLGQMVRDGGTIDADPHGLTYPIYTASLAVVVLRRLGDREHLIAADAWLRYLLDRQLTEQLGWRREDPEFGGWGYAADPLRRPAPGVTVPSVAQPNLSATLFALEALHSAGYYARPAGSVSRHADHPSVENALVFIQRCQNFSDDAKPTALDDGGFFFVHGDPVRNKAGVAGADGAGHTRYISYGSTTVDGVRGLLLCGLPRDHPRVKAASRWLAQHFDPEHHPGSYVAEREASRRALYFYYTASLARALCALGTEEVKTPTGTSKWAASLADALLKRQGKDGSWFNPAVDVREDDRLVATPLAVIALAACREALARGDYNRKQE
jgi:squalene-hopene/tetraprenyl-beta-curcumene cyclase